MNKFRARYYTLEQERKLLQHWNDTIFYLETRRRSDESFQQMVPELDAIKLNLPEDYHRDRHLLDRIKNGCGGVQELEMTRFALH